MGPGFRQDDSWWLADGVNVGFDAGIKIAAAIGDEATPERSGRGVAIDLADGGRGHGGETPRRVRQLPEQDEMNTGAKARSPTTLQLITKMRLLLTRRLEALEREPMEMPDKEMTLLSTMARTLGKLEEIDKTRKRATKRKSTERSPAMVELRKMIAARIDELNRA